MRWLLEWFERGWVRAGSVLAIVASVILGWAGVLSQLRAAACFLQQIWNACKEFLGHITSIQFSPDILVGIVLWGVIALLAVGNAVFYIVRFIRQRRPHYIPLAIDKATHSVQQQMQSAIRNARPRGVAQRDLSLWDQLASAALASQADNDLLGAHCEKGIRSQPVIFCNFRGYAHAVRAVLKELHNHEFDAPYPRVWTLLKRSVFEWYNPFPLASVGGGTERTIGRVTLLWWEDYKGYVKELKKSEAMSMYRLVAHPPLSDDLGRIQDYRLYSDSTLTLREARNKAETYGTAVVWLPWVEAALRAADDVAGEVSIHLIGKPNGSTARNAQPREDIVGNFANVFHSGPGRVNGDKPGVFLRYLHASEGFERLLTYDDLFIVALSDSLVFGLAFIDDEFLDINGMRILPPHQLNKPASGSENEALLNSLINAWKAGQNDFCVCRD